jgi:hypothetical protein
MVIHKKAKSIAKDPKDVGDEIRDRWPAPETQNPQIFWCPKGRQNWRSPKDELTET